MEQKSEKNMSGRGLNPEAFDWHSITLTTRPPCTHFIKLELNSNILLFSLVITDCDAPLNLNYANGEDTGKPRTSSSANPPPSSFFGSIWETYRWTRQLLVEGFGTRSKSIDPVLHAQIVALWGTRREYRNIGKTVATLATNFERFMQAQRDLAGAFRFMSVQEENLVDEFVYNAEMQDILYKNGCVLLGRSMNSGDFLA